MTPPKSHRILLVSNKDDQQFEDLYSYLADYYDVDMIHSAKGSSETLKRFQPHLIIVDNQIADKSGLRVLKNLRSKFKHDGVALPKTLLVASDADEIDQALRAKIDDCLSLTFTHRLVLQRIRYLLSDVEASSNFLRRVFQSTFEGVALFRKSDNKITYANPRMLKILGKTHQPSNLSANTITHIDDERRKILEEIHRAKELPASKLAIHLGEAENPCYVRIESYNSKLFIMFAEEIHAGNAYHQQYENLLNTCNSAMIIYKTDDETRRVFKVNQAIEPLLGYSPTELENFTRDRFVVHQEKNLRPTKASSHKFGHLVESLCCIVKHKQGHTVEVISTTYSTRLDDADVLVEVFEDVSASNEYRKVIKNLKTALNVVSSAINPDELIQATIDYLCDAINATAVNCMMIDGTQAIVTYRKTNAISFNVGTVRTGSLDLKEANALQWILKHKKVLYIADVNKSDLWYKTSQENWLKSYIGFPIINGDQVIGFINIDGAKIDQFTVEQIEHVTIVVEQLSKMLQQSGIIQPSYEQNDNKSSSMTISTDRQQYLDRQLTEQLTLFQQLLDHLPVHIYIKNRHGRFIYMNNTLAQTINTHFGIKDLIEISDDQLNWGEDFERSYRLERDIFTTKQPIINDHVVIAHPETGKETRYLTTKIPIFKDDGEILYVAGIDREITALQRTLDHVVDSVNCILWYADIVLEDDRYQWTYHLFSEAAAQRLLPLETSDNLPYMKAWQYAIFADDLKHIEQTANNALITETPEFNYEFRCTDKHGNIIWMREDARVTRLSQIHWRIDYIAVDVTERHQVLQELEARVQERTAELTQSNAQLQAEILERQRVEHALREQEHQYRTLTNQLPLGVYRVSLSGQFQYANKPFLQMFGFDSFEQLSEVSIIDFYVNQNIRAEMMAKAQKNHGQEQTSIVQFYRRDGKQIWIRANWRLMQTDEETYIDGIMEDITHTRMIQEIERDQRHFVEALQNASTDLSRSLNLTEVIKVVLKHVSRIMPKHQTAGVMLIENQEEVRSIAYQKQTPDGPEVHPTNNTFKMRLLPNLVKMYESKEPLAIPNTDIDPNWQYVEVTSWIKSYISSPIVVAGEVIGFLNLSSDTADTFSITHSQRLMAFASQVGIAIQNARMYESIQNHAGELTKRVAERTAELEHKTLQLQTILDAMTEGVIYYNQEIYPQFSNRSLVEITGYSLFDLKHDASFAELLQLSLDDFVHWRQDLQNTLDVAKVWHGEYQLKRKNGKLFDAYIGASRVHDEQENFFGFVMVIRDISQEKHLERQRINFITQASHQLRTPITNLKTYLYLIKRQPEQIESRLQVIEEVTEHLHQLVESLLEITKSASVDEHLRRFSIPVQAPIIEVVEAITAKAESKGLTIETQLPDEPIYVSVDPGQIKDALSRIFDNAITATDEGGQLSIRADVSDDKGHIIIKLSDTGIGIPSHLLSDIFTPFIRGLDDFSGAGIGLSIVKHIITLHSGTVEIESVENEGTTVTITLPIVSR